MGVVLVLTPVIIGSWPAITAAVAGAAAAMGLVAKGQIQDELKETQAAKVTRVEMELENSQVVAENLAAGKEMVFTKGAIQIHVTRDERGRCRICAEGKGFAEAELKQVAEEFSGKVTQAFIYNRVKTELKNKGFQVVNEEVTEDQTVRIHVRHWEN